ncbi:MAG: hypothetical protein RSB52_07300, partial [Acidaminococcaceae bacterium]
KGVKDREGNFYVNKDGSLNYEDNILNSALTPSSTDINYSVLTGAEKYQAAWHGSPNNFDEFLLDMIGAGEGKLAHDWGFYLAQDKEIADNYWFLAKSSWSLNFACIPVAYLIQ